MSIHLKKEKQKKEDLAPYQYTCIYIAFVQHLSTQITNCYGTLATLQSLHFQPSAKQLEGGYKVLDCDGILK